MRKHFLYHFVLIVINTIHSQTRGTKLGYIDMEYILQNVPNYAEATVNWSKSAKNDKKLRPKIGINKIKALTAEKPLLTKGLMRREN
jgi:Skp family chaperone for outer membrane proteins